ncbi:DUF6348 family protein [Streptomyces sp. MK5]|uniref:DUF6348 family protein n=1 Tax=Streptomyces sp. MK5 TaxID=3064253 RepID=UPI0027417EB4|nr:DUF6348 family protein [Streptomyces sp. MK5]
MSWIRSRARRAEQPDERLPDTELLALVKAGLEAFAPGVTEGAELKGNSLLSPHGWAVAVAPPRHGGGRHYDLVALPDVSIQPDVPCFTDCVVAISADPREAADAWVQTAGACLLELLDQRERFADQAGPEHERGVPGWRSIISGAVAFGLDTSENRRMQGALLEANVLHRVSDTFIADLESPFFNGVKVFYGGRPGAMETEVRVNGERHEAASAAMAALNLPEPTAFTAVRYYAVLLPLSADGATTSGPATDLDPHHAHDAECSCGGELDPEHPGFELTLPHLVAELSEEERAKRVRVDTGAMMVADGVGNFLKVRLPIPLEDGRTVVFLVWIYLAAQVIEEFVARVHDGTLPGHRFEGLLCNAVGPWGEEVLRAPVVLEGKPTKREGRVPYCEVVASTHPLLAKALNDHWPAEFVLGEHDPRLSP